MSYCRFSTDDFQCDVYCYEDVSGGWTTHVAGRRTIFPGPLPEPLAPDDWTAEAFLARHRTVTEMFDRAKHETIGLAHDGADFRDGTLEEFRATLVMLRDAGYRVPEYVFDVIDEEMGGLST